MDASASPKVDADFKDVYGFFLKIENTEFPTSLKQRSTVIKYTRLPEFDIESNGSWPRQNYTLQPRLRRIITLENPEVNTSRSLKPDMVVPSKAMTHVNKRKIVTITEGDECDLHPKFSRGSRKSNFKQTSNRAIGTEVQKEEKQLSHKTTSRLTPSSKYSKETKPSVKTSNAFERKDIVSSRSNYKSKLSNIHQVALDNRSKNMKEKETVRNTKSVTLSKSSVSKNLVTPSESEKELSFIKTKLCEKIKNDPKRHNVRPRASKSPSQQSKSKASMVNDVYKHKPLTVIRVPLDEKYHECNMMTQEITCPTIMDSSIRNCSTGTEVTTHKDMKTGTEPLASTVDRETEMEGFPPEIIYKCFQNADVQTDLIKETFDKLDVPNVTLKKDKSESKEQPLDVRSESLPNLEIPPYKITPHRDEKAFLDARYCKSTSYIISRATLTYRTKQKINFHVVGSNDNSYSNQSPSPLSYPVNVMSVFKKETSTEDISNNISAEENCEGKASKELKNSINEIKSLDCSYVSNSNKLMKPSDIISTMSVNNGLLQSDYICEQFQRELNFIDSFFESLQYLESCSLTEKSFKKDNLLVSNSALLATEFDVKNTEYDNFISKFENGPHSDDAETMASKNLFLLNILIRDEQRRAKNLLFVLKRREDALKDFTKSQILYLENKKKQENTDISALKKKQRGALVKLQHECGEMQRMRKALLTLSEKRKLALMKTKRDLELKLKNNVDVEQIILGKKKLKRITSLERTSVPLKCFDLSSSGGEDSTTSRHTSEASLPTPEIPAVANPITSVEKSIQTGDSILDTTTTDQPAHTAAENFVAVDGGYLNILFHNLSLPHIFSGGKQYEVNEEALKNIVSSANSQHSERGSCIVEHLMDQIKNREQDKCSTPSTARSLVEEFDQYYKGLAEDDKFQDDYSDYQTPPKVFEISDAMVQACEWRAPSERQSNQSGSTMTFSSTQTAVEFKVQSSDESNESDTCEALVTSPTGPLPVPAGAADVTEPTSNEIPSWLLPKSPSASTFSDLSTASSQSLCGLATSMSSLAAPVQIEAEELRRQQLAIEQEIKELEQQQCRLLVVREIPDKPPPPYTPPSDTRPKLPRMFRPDEVTQDRIQKAITNLEEASCDPHDAFDVFISDFCHESLERHKLDQSEKPWDACNLLPQKPYLESTKLVRNISNDLMEVLTAVPPTAVSGVSSRRADHIDDILFAEWRRVEPEWTTLQGDEAVVKNQLFETIFQRILNETVDEYKRTVLEQTD